MPPLPSSRLHPADIHDALSDAEYKAYHFAEEARKRDDLRGAQLYTELAESICTVRRQAATARSGQNWARTGESVRSRVLSSVDQ